MVTTSDFESENSGSSPDAAAILKTAAQIIADYQGLTRRVLMIVSRQPFYSSVDKDDIIALTIENGNVMLRWKTYETDCYGGGWMRNEEFGFPEKLLLLSADEIASFHDRAEQEEKERNKRVRAAQHAVDLQRSEARDRAEYARLSAKYGIRPAPG